jgi:secondary thiamine-phosphate synthase enzyme
LTELSVPTRRREEMVDITDRVQEQVGRSGVSEGVCHVYVPHTTCGITINEGADPAVQHDFLQHIDELVPQSGEWRHAEGNSDSHIKSMLVGSSVAVPVLEGKLRLGRWQALFLCEFDGPRQREVWVQVL